MGIPFSHWKKPFPSPGDVCNPGIEHRTPALQADSLPAEPQKKPKNTGEGSLALLQWMFPTKKLNWGSLHCRWVLYRLSYQESPVISFTSWQIDGETIETVTDIFPWAPNSLQRVTAVMKVKTLAPWKKRYDKPRQYINKQRHYFAHKGWYSQSYGFSSGHVWMYMT